MHVNPRGVCVCKGWLCVDNNSRFDKNANVPKEGNNNLECSSSFKVCRLEVSMHLKQGSGTARDLFSVG